MGKKRTQGKSARRRELFAIANARALRLEAIFTPF
jgi:hypothetical protein